MPASPEFDGFIVFMPKAALIGGWIIVLTGSSAKRRAAGWVSANELGRIHPRSDFTFTGVRWMCMRTSRAASA
jgi:hypothetical protein